MQARSSEISLHHMLVQIAVRRVGEAAPASGFCRQHAHVFLMPEERPNLSASSLIWTASSRVGASTSTVGPARGSLRVALMCSMPGSRKPHVLPEPVRDVNSLESFPVSAPKSFRTTHIRQV